MDYYKGKEFMSRVVVVQRLEKMQGYYLTTQRERVDELETVKQLHILLHQMERRGNGHRLQIQGHY